MKRVLPTLAIVLLLTAGCKKETTEPPLTPPPADPFAANAALIDTAANVYFIADVEGLSGTTKVNEQKGHGCCSENWGGGSCTTGSCHYGGGLGCPTPGINWTFSIDYYGTGETREQLFTSTYTTLIATGQSHGVRIVYYAPNGKVYDSSQADNSTHSWANIALQEMHAITGNPPYSMELRFNCELKEFGGTETIRLKNAIVRVEI